MSTLNDLWYGFLQSNQPFSIEDDFNRPDSQSLGSNWAVNPRGWAVVGQKATPLTQSVNPTAAWMATIPSPDHKIQADVFLGTSVNAAISTGLLVRVIDGSNCYGCRYNKITGNMLIYRILASTTVSLANVNVPFPDGSEMGLRVKGQTLTVDIAGVDVLSYTDSDTTLADALGAGLRTTNPDVVSPAYGRVIITLT